MDLVESVARASESLPWTEDEDEINGSLMKMLYVEKPMSADCLLFVFVESFLPLSGRFHGFAYFWLFDDTFYTSYEHLASMCRHAHSTEFTRRKSSPSPVWTVDQLRGAGRMFWGGRGSRS